MKTALHSLSDAMLLLHSFLHCFLATQFIVVIFILLTTAALPTYTIERILYHLVLVCVYCTIYSCKTWLL